MRALPMMTVTECESAKWTSLTVKVYGGVPFFGVTEMSVHYRTSN